MTNVSTKCAILPPPPKGSASFQGIFSKGVLIADLVEFKTSFFKS